MTKPCNHTDKNAKGFSFGKLPTKGIHCCAGNTKKHKELIRFNGRFYFSVCIYKCNICNNKNLVLDLII